MKTRNEPSAVSVILCTPKKLRIVWRASLSGRYAVPMMNTTAITAANGSGSRETRPATTSSPPMT